MPEWCKLKPWDGNQYSTDQMVYPAVYITILVKYIHVYENEYVSALCIFCVCVWSFVNFLIEQLVGCENKVTPEL